MRWGVGIGKFGEAAEEFAAFEGFGDFDGSGVRRGGDAIPGATECGEDDDACAVVGGLEHEALWVGLIEAGDVDDDLVSRREVLEGDIEGGDVVNDHVPLLTLEVEELTGGGMLAVGEQAAVLNLLQPLLLDFATLVIGSDFEGHFEIEVGAATGFAGDVDFSAHEAAEFS